MASQQDIKRRIRSVRNTRKITKAMELVAAAKLRRAQARIEALRPFAERMEQLTMEAAARANVHGEPLLVRREVQNVVIMPITGDRGLAGAFNTQIVRRALQLAAEHESQGRGVRWLSIGKKGTGTLRFRGVELGETWQGFSDAPTYAVAERIGHAAADLYIAGEVDLVQIVYNQFESALSQRVTVADLLPVPEGRLEELSARERALEGDMLFEPEAEDMLGDLLLTSIETTLYRALLESAASEHGARMTAMGNASKNAGELIDSYTLAMNRARQAEITQAILEVVAGADALE